MLVASSGRRETPGSPAASFPGKLGRVVHPSRADPIASASTKRTNPSGGYTPTKKGGEPRRTPPPFCTAFGQVRSLVGCLPLLISAERSKVVDSGLYGEDAIESGHRLARRSPSQGLGTRAAGSENQREIARALGVTEGAVSRWMKRGRQGGVEALRKRTSPGAPPRLSEEQRAHLKELLAQGARPTTGFGARCGPAKGRRSDPKRVRGCLPSGAREPTAQGVGAFFAEANTPSEPAGHEEAIERWKQEQRWPQLKKGRGRGGQNHPVRGAVRFLSFAMRGAHLRPGGSDARTPP
jgi:hypothetical protein